MNRLLDLFFPPFCVGCGHIGTVFCKRCETTIIPVSPFEMICPVCEKRSIDGFTHTGCKTKYGIDGLVSFFYYKGAIRQYIKEIKYSCSYAISSEITKRVNIDTFFILETFFYNSVLVPVPLHTLKEKQRGFNQAMVFAKEFQKEWNIPINAGVLTRTKNNIPQASLSNKQERIQNIQHVFHALFPIEKTVFLLDDVFTTGATLRDAARALKRAGTKSVYGVTIAR